MQHIFFTGNHLLGGYSLLQAGSIYGESRVGWMTRDVHRITLLFLALNTVAYLYQCSNTNTPNIRIHALSVLASSGGGLLYYFKGTTPKTIKSEEFTIEGWKTQNGAPIQGTYTLKQVFPDSQVALQSLIVALTLQTLASLCFDPKNPLLYLQLAGMSTSLYQARQMNWIGIHHQSPITHHFQTREASSSLQPAITYFALISAPKNKGEDEECPIGTCPVDEVNLFYYYCSNKHRFCRDCLIDGVFGTQVKALASALMDKANRFDCTHTITVEQSGRRYHSNSSYTFYYKEEEAPRCSTCREAPGHAFVSFLQGGVKVVGKETNAKSPFWARSLLLYSIAHLTLTAVQHVDPKLAPLLYRVQSYALPLDALLAGAFFVSEAKMFNVDPKKDKTLLISAAIAILAFSLLIAYDWKKKGTDLTSLLTSSLPEEALKNLKITDHSPGIHLLLEKIYFAKFFIPLAAASFSTNRNVLLLAALINGLNFAKMASVNWISFERTYTGSVLGCADSATPRLYVFLPNPGKLFKGENPLQQAVQSLYEFTNTFFDKSSWHGYWRVITRNGVKIGRKLIFDATIHPQEWLVNGINLFDFVRHWSGTAYRRYDGVGQLNLDV
ncbi:MAG: hypothetical protein H7A38_04005 [Chlamydiales bacterium]|nr:hypothetical protein [Chlamydiales bacterium]